MWVCCPLLSSILLFMSMLLIELKSFEDGTGFLSSTFGLTGSKLGLLVTFDSTFGYTFVFEMIDVS